MRWFGREPALYLAIVLGAAQLAALLAHLDKDQQNWLSVGITAAYGVAIAVLTRPVDTAVLTGGIATLATALGAFGFHVPADVVSAFNGVLVAVLAVTVTNRISPSPAIDPRRQRPV